jgi:L-malate glycosyltransferase
MNSFKVYLVENQHSGLVIGGINSYIKIIGQHLQANGIEWFYTGSGSEPGNMGNTNRFISLNKQKISNLQFFFLLFFQIKRFPDSSDVLYHFHHPYMGLPFIFFRKKAQCLLTLHGRQDLSFLDRKGFLKYSLLNTLNRMALYRYKLIMADNQNLQEYYTEKFKINPGRIKLLNVPVDLNVFYPMDKGVLRKKYGFDQATKIILYAGRFEKEKNLVMLLDAFKILKTKLENLSLLLVGRGRQSETILLKLAGENIKGVQLFGAVEQNILAELMNCTDVFALPSLHEGGPMVIKEALACNLPVVSTDVGDVKMLIQNLNGCDISDCNPSDFADKLFSILNTETDEDFSASVKKYSMDSFGDKMMAFYNSAVVKI